MASNDQIAESPGGKPMGPIGVGLITIYFVLIAVIVIHSLVVLWPPNRLANGEDTPASTAVQSTPASSTPGSSGAQKDNGECGDQTKAELFWFLPLCLSEEERLFLIVLFSGALGGLVHSLRSFYWYLGNRKLVLSWAGMYITLPVLGACLATVFYLVVRGGFFSPQSQVSDTSPFGFAAMAALIGMFTEQAVEKLKQVSETLLSPAPKGKNTAGPGPIITGVQPSSGSQGINVTLTGREFAQGATVRFGDQPATNVQVASNGTSLTADTPAGTGSVIVEVINPDQQKGSLPNGFTYT